MPRKCLSLCPFYALISDGLLVIRLRCHRTFSAGCGDPLRSKISLLGLKIPSAPDQRQRTNVPRPHGAGEESHHSRRPTTRKIAPGPRPARHQWRSGQPDISPDGVNGKDNIQNVTGRSSRGLTHSISAALSALKSPRIDGRPWSSTYYSTAGGQLRPSTWLARRPCPSAPLPAPAHQTRLEADVAHPDNHWHAWWPGRPGDDGRGDHPEHRHPGPSRAADRVAVAVGHLLVADGARITLGVNYPPRGFKDVKTVAGQSQRGMVATIARSLADFQGGHLVTA